MGSELAARLAARHLKLAQFCGFDLVELNLKSKGKKGVIKEIANLLAKSHNVESEEAALEALIEREDLASTGIGYGIAVPHGKSQHCKGLTIAFGRSIKGVNFGSIDGAPVHYLFGILVPITSVQLHLQIMASLSLLLQGEKNRKCLETAQFPQEILDFLDGKE